MRVDCKYADLPPTITCLDICNNEQRIKGQLRIAWQIAVWYAQRYRTDPNRMVSAAFLGLTEAVNRFREGNIGAYCASWIHGECKRELGIHNSVHDELTEMPVRVKELELEDMLSGLSPLERVAAERLAEGYNKEECAKLLHMCATTFRKLLTRLREKLGQYDNLRKHKLPDQKSPEDSIKLKG